MDALLVNTDKELLQILDLQKQNLRGANSEAQEEKQGFVTVTHSLEKLKQLNSYGKSVIVKDNEQLAGYALVMSIDCSAVIPELFSLFERVGKMRYRGKLLSSYHFYVMGQICVAAAYRGKGVFEMLYEKHRDVYKHKYEFVITSIAKRNRRSMRAHQKAGFTILESFTDELDEWDVVIWDWNKM